MQIYLCRNCLNHNYDIYAVQYRLITLMALLLLLNFFRVPLLSLKITAEIKDGQLQYEAAHRGYKSITAKDTQWECNAIIGPQRSPKRTNQSRFVSIPITPSCYKAYCIFCTSCAMPWHSPHFANFSWIEGLWGSPWHSWQAGTCPWLGWHFAQVSALCFVSRACSKLKASSWQPAQTSFPWVIG